MAPPERTIHHVRADLAIDDPAKILYAAWDAFDLVLGLADSIVFDGISDELQVGFVAMYCSLGTGLMPMPMEGAFVTPAVPQLGSAWLEPYIALMRQVNESLRRLAQSPPPGWEDATPQLLDAAEQADLCAFVLPRVRPTTGAAA